MGKKTETKRVELKDSKVVFNEQNHTYVLGDKFLSGITGMLSRQLYPNEYKDVDPATLAKAAEYGTGVHKAIEMFDVEWDMDFGHETEIEDYKAICRDNSLVHESTEYCVTDGEHWASNIDKVYRVSDDTFDLGDLKTYGAMTPDKKEKARWQLSIYAYLFELQNKKAKVGRLFIIHLRNKMKRSGNMDHIADFIEVKRIPAEICKDLLDSDVAGIKFKNPYAIPDKYRDMESRIAELIKQKDDAEKELAEIKTQILTEMEEIEQKTWATDTMKITRNLPTLRSGFDVKKLRDDHPEIDFSKYETTTLVKGSVKISI